MPNLVLLCLVFEKGLTVFEEGLTVFEEDSTVFEEGLTVFEEGLTVFEEGLTVLEAGLADSGLRETLSAAGTVRRGFSAGLWQAIMPGSSCYRELGSRVVAGMKTCPYSSF